MNDDKSIVYHAENHVSGLSFPCKRCTETFTTRLKLHRHNHENHKDRKEDPRVTCFDEELDMTKDYYLRNYEITYYGEPICINEYAREIARF